MYKPHKQKYKKMHKQRIKNIVNTKINKFSNLNFGTYALKALHKGEIKPNQIEATRKVLSRKIKKSGKIWIQIFCHIVRTSKPAEVRMGKGKGSADYWTCFIHAGQILFETSNIDMAIAYSLLKSASKKLPILTKIVKKI